MYVNKISPSGILPGAFWLNQIRKLIEIFYSLFMHVTFSPISGYYCEESESSWFSPI